MKNISFGTKLFIIGIIHLFMAGFSTTLNDDGLAISFIWGKLLIIASFFFK